MKAQRFKTLQAKAGPRSFIKPGELIDVVEMTPLTLSDRRIYNQLLAGAWERIDEDVTHTIAKCELRGSHNVNDRVGESILRLMAATVQVYVERDGEPYIRRVQLLGGNDESMERDGFLHYTFPPELRSIIKESSIFARIRKDVMYALSSKYALALYEMIQKRGNLQHQWSEEFEVERFRQLLGVEESKLGRFADLNAYAIKPAVLEVNGLADYGCKVEPIVKSRKVVSVRLVWWRKSVEELKAAYSELQASKVGRRARLSGSADRLSASFELARPEPAPAKRLPVPIRPGPGQAPG